MHFDTLHTIQWKWMWDVKSFLWTDVNTQWYGTLIIQSRRHSTLLVCRWLRGTKLFLGRQMLLKQFCNLFKQYLPELIWVLSLDSNSENKTEVTFCLFLSFPSRSDFHFFSFCLFFLSFIVSSSSSLILLGTGGSN